MKVSVVIASYRHSDLLNKCLDSLKNQTVAPDEIIVAFDSPHYLNGIKTVSSATTGVSAARNVGCDEATGDILAFIDDDAEADPRWIEHIKYYFEFSGFDVMGGPVIPTFETKNLPTQWSFIYGCTWNVRRPICCNMAIRRDVFFKMGKFNTGLGRIKMNLSIGEETELILKLQEQGYKIGWDEDCVVFHWVPTSRTTLSYFCSRAYKEGIGKAIIGKRYTLDTEGTFLKYYIIHPDWYTVPVLISVFIGFVRGKLL